MKLKFILEDKMPIIPREIITYFSSYSSTEDNSSSNQRRYFVALCSDFYYELNYLCGVTLNQKEKELKENESFQVLRYPHRRVALTEEIARFHDGIVRSANVLWPYFPNDESKLTGMLMEAIHGAKVFYASLLTDCDEEAIQLLAMQGVDRMLEYMTHPNADGVYPDWTARSLFCGLALGDSRRWAMAVTTKETSPYRLHPSRQAEWRQLTLSLNDLNVGRIEKSLTNRSEEGSFLRTLVNRYQDDFRCALEQNLPSIQPSHSTASLLQATSLQLIDQAFSDASSEPPLLEEIQENEVNERTSFISVMTEDKLRPAEKDHWQELSRQLVAYGCNIKYAEPIAEDFFALVADNLKRLGYFDETVQDLREWIKIQLLERQALYAPNMLEKKWIAQVQILDLQNQSMFNFVLRELARLYEVNVVIFSLKQPIIIHRAHVELEQSIILSNTGFDFYAVDTQTSHAQRERLRALLNCTPSETDHVAELEPTRDTKSIPLSVRGGVDNVLTLMKYRFYRMCFRDSKQMSLFEKLVWADPLFFEFPLSMAVDQETPKKLQEMTLSSLTKNFLEHSNQGWLIKGSEIMDRQLIFQALQKGIDQNDEYIWIPLFVPLAELNEDFEFDKDQFFLPQYLAWRGGYTSAHVNFLKKRYRFLIVIEGLDQSPIHVLKERFYSGAELSGWGLSKIVFMTHSNWTEPAERSKNHRRPLLTTHLNTLAFEDTATLSQPSWKDGLLTKENQDLFESFFRQYPTLYPLIGVPSVKNGAGEIGENLRILASIFTVLSPYLKQEKLDNWPNTHHALYAAWCFHAFGREHAETYAAIQFIALELFKTGKSFIEIPVEASPYFPEPRLQDWPFLEGKQVEEPGSQKKARYVFRETVWFDYFVAEALWEELQPLVEIRPAISLWNQRDLKQYHPGILAFLVERIHTSPTASLDFAILQRRWLDNTGLIGREKAYQNVLAVQTLLRQMNRPALNLPSHDETHAKSSKFTASTAA